MQGIGVPVEDPRNGLRLRKLMPSDEHLKEKTKEEVEKQDVCFKYLTQDLKCICSFEIHTMQYFDFHRLLCYDDNDKILDLILARLMLKSLSYH